MRAVALPLGAMGMLGIVLFPLPSGLLDFLLVLNLSFSVLLLLSILAIDEPLRFTSLPAVLLLSTLVRLALNISTTRLLLGSGSAPQVVKAFGEYVVGGNLLVGVVVFVMLTLVQFLVVAKGAERVAEVAARFTLDAMPGKQMAIDADIRSGILGLAEAKLRRLELQRESQLYGALDGAMKFVKGDAIAGIAIIAVNICAGLYIGVQQRGMPIAAALREYTLFTIGDGLLALLPALLVAVSAGVAVTRVSGAHEGGIGAEFFAQITQDGRALLCAAVGLLAIGAIPGVPILPFSIVAAAFAVQSAYVSAPRAGEVNGEGEVVSPLVTEIALVASNELLAIVHDEQAYPRLLAEFKARTFERWGLLIPESAFSADSSVSDREIKVVIRGVELRRERWSGASGELSKWILSLLEDTIANHRGWIVNDTQTRLLIDRHHAVHEDMINAVVPKLLSVTGLTVLLRGLVEEGVSVRPFACILQAVSECSVDQRASAELLLEFVRGSLARSISSTVSEDGRVVKVHLLNNELQERLLRAAAGADGGAIELVKPEVQEPTIEAARRALADSMGRLVVVCPGVIRRGVSELLRARLGRLERERVYVLAPQELLPDLSIEAVGTL